MSTSTTSPMSSSELAFLGTLLAMVAEQFSYKSCTDYALDPSAEHKAIVAAAIERIGQPGWEDYAAAVMAEEEQIVIFMDWMAEHLGARCQEHAPSGAELAMIVDLLEVAREDHDDAEDLGLVPHAIEASDANRAILAQISDEATRPPGHENSVPFKAALIHFSERCAS
jgi:hypothetical protein